MTARSTQRRARRAALPAALLGVTVALAGCAAGTPGDDDQVTIIWWDRMDTEGQNKTIEAWISGFEAENPGITIERTYVPPAQYRQNVLAAAAGGDAAPDIILYDTIDTAGYAEAGVLLDLTEYFEAREDADKFTPGIIDGARYDGGLYQVPYNVQVMGLYANTEILDAAGIELPATLDEWAAAVKAATTADTNGIAAAFATPFASYTFTPILYTLGGSYEDLDSPEGLAALEFIKAWFADGSIPLDAATSTVLEAIDPFLQGRAAFGFNGTWMAGSVTADAALAEKIVGVPLPGATAGKLGNTVALSNGASILATSKHPDEAWKVIEYITRAQQSLLLSENTGALSPRTDVLTDDADLVKNNRLTAVFREELARALPRPSTPEWGVIEEAITTMVQSVAIGDVEPQEALSRAAAVVSAALGK